MPTVFISTFWTFFFRNLFPSPSKFTLRPGALTTAFSPHLENQTSLALAVLIAPPAISFENSTVSIVSSYLLLTSSYLETVNTSVEIWRVKNVDITVRILDQCVVSLGQLTNFVLLSKKRAMKQQKSFLCSIVQVLSLTTESVLKQSGVTRVEWLGNCRPLAHLYYHPIPPSTLS